MPPLLRLARFPAATVAPAALALATLLPLAAPTPAPAFDGDRAAATVRTIAADDFGGRFSGLASGRRIEEHVAARFAEWGLAPAGSGGTFFHDFDLLVTEERGASLTLLDGPFGRVEFLHGDDFALCTNSGSGAVTAEVVIAGHGLFSPDREWDDWGDLDAKGKIVLIERGTPDNGWDWGEAGSRDSTLHEAVRRGAAAVVFRRDRNAVQGAAVHDGSYFPKIPSLVAGERVFDHLLRDTGYDLDRYREELKKKPLPMLPRKRMRLRASVRRVPDGRARNVAGMVEGSDPRLANEVIVVGAHMDHVGRGAGGIVFNGANDNGSGTSVVLELARSLAAAPERPKRTVVFVTFAAEEQGLLGSEAFVKDPPLDLDRAVAMINFDMVGHGNGKVGFGGGEYYPPIRAAFKAALDSARADSLVVGRAWGGDSSDHGPFRRAGIPVMNIWSDGDHRFYHTLEDDAQWIDPAVLGSVGRMAETWIRTLADWPEPLRAERRAGRSMLYAADQVDFDGVLGGGARDGGLLGGDAPPWVRATVRWFDAASFGGAAYLDTLAAWKRRADEDEDVAVVRSLKDVREKTKDGRRAVLIGLRGSSARGSTAGPGLRPSPSRLPFLASLDAGAVLWDAATAAATDSATVAALAKAGLVFVGPPDAMRAATLPADAKRCVRFFPGRGERLAEPDSLPRKGTRIVVGYEGGLPAAELASVITDAGWDRVHLDLVPWLARVEEPAITAFLEELQAAGPFEPAQMRSLLGGGGASP